MKKKYLIAYIMFFIFFTVLLINNKLLSLDEIWCYGFTKHIAEGYIPYRDYNLIQTPLFFFIGTFFSKSLILFRVYGALINAAIVILTFYICRKNKIDKQLSIIITFINVFFVSLIAFSNYNTLLVLGLMILYLVAIRFFKEMNRQNSFLFGFLLSIVLLIKQNVPGILIIIFTSVLFVLLLRRLIPFKTFFYYVIGGIIPVLIFVCYSLINHSLTEFVSYTIIGLSSFSQNKIIRKGFQVQHVLIFLSLIITIYIAKDTIKAKSYKIIHFTTLIFTLSSYIFIYPIVDIYHSCLLLIFNIYLSVTLLEGISIKLKYIKYVITFSLIMSIICFSSLHFKPTMEGFVRSKMDYYYYILLPEDIENNLSKVASYVKEQEEKGFDVAIISKSAYFYNLPANDYNGILDLLLIGNMGTMSNSDIISLVDKKDIILAYDFYQYQDIKEVREYVFNNYIQDGTIGNMRIYKKY